MPVGPVLCRDVVPARGHVKRVLAKQANAESPAATLSRLNGNILDAC